MALNGRDLSLDNISRPSLLGLVECRHRCVELHLNERQSLDDVIGVEGCRLETSGRSRRLDHQSIRWSSDLKLPEQSRLFILDKSLE